MITPIDTLQYLNQEDISASQRLQGEYYRDLIRHHGIECTYFKNHARYPSLTGQDNMEYTFGDAAPLVYTLSADMLIYMEAGTDLIVVNMFGAVPDSHGRISFMKDEFNYAFDTMGTTSALQVSVAYSGTVSASTLTITSAFVSDDSWLSGLISGEFTLSTSGNVSGNLTPHFYLYSALVPVNDMIYSPNYYNYIKTFEDDLSASYSGFLSAGTSGTVSGTISGTITYNKLRDFEDYKNIISPAPGDYIRIQFSPDNFEEFELTQVIDRNLLADGINPLLGKYIWMCDITRRSYSFEISGTTEQHINTDIADIEKNLQNDISDDLFDYGTSAVDDVDPTNSDRVYGGF